MLLYKLPEIIFSILILLIVFLAFLSWREERGKKMRRQRHFMDFERSIRQNESKY